MIIGISVMQKEHLQGTGETIKSVRAKLNKNMFVLAEGEAFRAGEELATEMGADFYAKDLASAIEWAEELYNKVKW
jgi:methanogenic corrinoid protein MtbC1